MPPSRDPLVAIRVSATKRNRVGQPGEVRLFFDAAASSDGARGVTASWTSPRDPVLCQASIGAERTEGGGSEARGPIAALRVRSESVVPVDRILPRQCLGIVCEAARSSATCTITACALVYAAGQ
jgi:hypothetical protein